MIKFFEVKKWDMHEIAEKLEERNVSQLDVINIESRDSEFTVRIWYRD